MSSSDPIIIPTRARSNTASTVETFSTSLVNTPCTPSSVSIIHKHMISGGAGSTGGLLSPTNALAILGQSFSNRTGGFFNFGALTQNSPKDVPDSYSGPLMSQFTNPTKFDAQQSSSTIQNTSHSRRASYNPTVSNDLDQSPLAHRRFSTISSNTSGWFSGFTNNTTLEPSSIDTEFMKSDSSSGASETLFRRFSFKNPAVSPFKEKSLNTPINQISKSTSESNLLSAPFEMEELDTTSAISTISKSRKPSARRRSDGQGIKRSISPNGERILSGHYNPY